MKEWWKSKREAWKDRRRGGNYDFFDFVIEILLWVPELLLLPFRLLFWMFKGVGRVISHILDLT